MELQRSPVYAGFWRRFLASFLDGTLLSVTLYPLDPVSDLVLERVFDAGETVDDLWPAFALGLAVYMTMFIAVSWLYFAVMESSSWQATLGKRALGMVVTDLAGNRISFDRATGRFFARYISGIPLWLGYLIQPFMAKRQALHDIIAGTLVMLRP